MNRLPFALHPGQMLAIILTLAVLPLLHANPARAEDWKITVINQFASARGGTYFGQHVEDEDVYLYISAGTVGNVYYYCNPANPVPPTQPSDCSPSTPISVSFRQPINLANVKDGVFYLDGNNLVSAARMYALLVGNGTPPAEISDSGPDPSNYPYPYAFWEFTPGSGQAGTGSGDQSYVDQFSFPTALKIGSDECRWSPLATAQSVAAACEDFPPLVPPYPPQHCTGCTIGQIPSLLQNVTFTTNQGTSIAGSRVIAPTQSNVGNNGVVPGGAACYYNFFTGFNDYLHWLKNHPQNADGYPISWYAYAGFPKQNYNCRLKVIGENNNYAITLSNFYDSLEQPNICDFTGSHGNAVSGTVTYGANSVIFNNGPGFSYSNNPPPAGPFPCLGNWTDLTLFSASWKGTGNISVSGDLGTPQYLATVASVLYSVSAAMGCGYLGSDAYFNNQMCTDTFFKSVTPAELPANCFQYSLFGGQPKTNFFNQYWQVLAQQGGQAAGYVVPFHDRFPLLKALLYWPTPSDTATWYLGSVSAPPPPPGPCQSDFDHSGLVDSNDLTILLGAWGTSGQGQYDADVDNDGFVGPSDLVHTLAAFGESGIKVPSWATAIQYQPDPTVVTDSALLQRIENACYAWQVYDTQSQVKMVLVPDGSFQMGCIPSDQSPCQPDESPTHTVTLSKPFYMSQTEVTQAQWHAQTQSNPSYHQGDLNPVERVSWDGLNTFLKTSPGMRLPTEAEWEYAYLAAGTTTKAFHGFVNPQAGGVSRPDGTNDETLVGNIAWYLGNSSSQTHAVAGKFANGLGLYDMSGNVWEWVYDCYGPYTPASQTDPTGPTGSCPSRVLRGGSYSYSAANLRASNRDSFTSGSSDADIGFRVVKDVD